MCPFAVGKATYALGVDLGYNDRGRTQSTTGERKAYVEPCTTPPVTLEAAI